MTEKKQLPAFKSEAEEAAWWFDNREKHAEEFIQAMAEGRVKRGNPLMRLAAKRGVHLLELNQEDFSKAKQFANERGLEVESYLSRLVHDALEREEQSAA